MVHSDSDFINDHIPLKIAVCVFAYFRLQTISQKIFPAQYLKQVNSDKTKEHEHSEKTKEFHQRVLSSFNCILLTTSISFLHGSDMMACLTNSNQAYLEKKFNNEFDEKSKYLLIQLFGYMILDTFWCYWHEYNSVLNFLHHFVTIGYCWSMLTYNDSCLEAMIGLWLSEFSNLFLNWYWFAQFFGWKSEKISGFGFVGSFIMSRVFLASWLVYWLFTIGGSPPMRITGVVLSCINVGFLYKIIENLMNHFTGKGAKLE